MNRRYSNPAIDTLLLLAEWGEEHCATPARTGSEGDYLLTDVHKVSFNNRTVNCYLKAYHDFFFCVCIRRLLI